MREEQDDIFELRYAPVVSTHNTISSMQTLHMGALL